ncbi:hypothetical protein LAZ67_5004445 [Cordylochernes scorpioides]|uniref:Uncharacterized protein n=1 Tax=Cordylochernes scorpioides TaxID=51811 RepID=A0ABY6KI09_9ARAC|nr:hypothetical protein LAZ67_5004445 [Cordylochernes scorpioides]
MKSIYGDICQKHIARYGNGILIFLNRIASGDKTWIHHYQPESKRQTMAWKHPNSLCKKITKANHPQEN